MSASLLRLEYRHPQPNMKALFLSTMSAGITASDRKTGNDKA